MGNNQEMVASEEFNHLPWLLSGLVVGLVGAAVTGSLNTIAYLALALIIGPIC